jgi:hypothetical protein
MTVRLIGLQCYWKVRHWRFWATVGLTVVVLMLGGLLGYGPVQVPGVPMPAMAPHYYNAFIGLLNGLGGSLSAPYALLVAVLASGPTGDAIAADREWGADAVLIGRSGWRGYAWGTVVGGVLMAGSAALIGIGMTFGLAMLEHAPQLPKLLGTAIPHPSPPSSAGVFTEDYGPHFLRNLFWAHPWVYVTLVAGLAIWETMAFAGLALAAGCWIRHRLACLAIPFAGLLAGNVIFEMLNHQYWMPSTMIQQYLMVENPSWAAVVGYWAVPMAAAAFLVMFAARRQEWWSGGAAV